MTKRIIAIALAAFVIAAVPFPLQADDSGTFRGKWWNYYDRAADRAAKGELPSAVSDLTRAIGMRDSDQLMARTYGMHFIDYFPHRELGVILYLQGELEKALAELETSYRQQESAKAAYYLNQVRKGLFRQQGATFLEPEIIIDSPAPGSSISGSSVKVSGRVMSRGLVAKASINNRSIGIDLARQEQPFEQELPLEEGDEAIRVVAADLLGTTARRELPIIVDRDGPAFSLDRVSREGRFARVSGTVEDRTGIAGITIAGERVSTSGGRIQRFDVRVNYARKIELRTVDTLGNETVAAFDPEREIVARAVRKPLLLAAAGAFTLFDRQPPALVLKDSVEPPAVFVDRYYVEGEAGDDGGIDRILVNGHQVTLAKGKKVFFSKVVKLAEGTNRITVEVHDRAGNRNQASFSVRRVVPAAMQVSSRMAVTLLPLDGPAAGEGARLGDSFLTAAFVDQKRFQVLDREKLLHILREQKFAREKLTDPDQTLKVGRLIAADAVIASSVREDKRSLEVVARVIDTETGEVMDVKDIYTEDKGIASLREQMEGLASKIARSFPVAGGMVISRERKEVLSDLGTASRIRKSMGAVFYRKGKEISHPVTGRSLGWDTVNLGEGRFEEVQKGFSRLRLSDSARQNDLGAKDLLITR